MFDFVLDAVPIICATYALDSVGEPPSGTPPGFQPGWSPPPPPPPPPPPLLPTSVLYAFDNSGTLDFIVGSTAGVNVGDHIVVSGNTVPAYNTTHEVNAVASDWQISTTSSPAAQGTGGTYVNIGP